MNVLAIDTSNQVMSVAVLKNDQVAAEYTTNVKINHSVRLMPAINEIMEETKLTPQDLDLIAVAIGPGSYTGVRIGLTTAKTMAWSLQIPIVGVSSLELVAYNGQLFEGLVCPFFDARRGQVYTGLYTFSQDQEMNIVLDEINILFTDWLEQLKEQGKPILFLSMDLDVHKEVIKEYLGDQAIFGLKRNHVPSASMLAEIAMKKDRHSLHSLTPNYLRLAEAEAIWLNAQQENESK